MSVDVLFLKQLHFNNNNINNIRAKSNFCIYLCKLFLEKSDLLSTKPLSYLNLNFTPPSGKQPSLMTFEDMNTLFYEVCNICNMLMASFSSLIAPCGFGASRIEPLYSPACHKRRLMEASRGLPAEAMPSVVKV